MLVEFFGLPGSGKSSLSRHVAEALAAFGLTVDEITYDLDHRRAKPARVLLKLACLVRHVAAVPRQSASSSWRIAGTRQATWSDLRKSALNWIFISSLASRERPPNRITLLDQGVAQALWSIGFAARHDLWLDLVLKDGGATAMKPDLVIHVRADRAIISERLSRRVPQVSRLERELGAGERPLIRAELQAEAVIDRLKAAGVRVIELSNEEPAALSRNAGVVVDGILRLLHGAGHASAERQRIVTRPLHDRLAEKADPLATGRSLLGREPHEVVQAGGGLQL